MVSSSAASAPRSEVRAALKTSGSVGLAIFPIGIAFGLLVVHSGLAWWWASVFSSVIFAGSLEFLLIGLTVAAAPLAQIALTAFLVNSRHVFYTLSFPLHQVTGAAGKAYSTFALTDEAYALTTSDTARSWPSRRILWIQASMHAYWVTGATAGAALGAVIPAHIAGLDFAMTALFAVLAIDAFRARRDIPTPIVAVACGSSHGSCSPARCCSPPSPCSRPACWPATPTESTESLMPHTPYLLAAVAVSAAVTWGLRALPFTVLAPLRASAAVGYLSARMPLGVMVILLAYTLRNLPVADPGRALPDILALAATVGLQLWRRNAVLSILGGIAVHAALTTALSVH